MVRGRKTWKIFCKPLTNRCGIIQSWWVETTEKIKIEILFFDWRAERLRAGKFSFAFCKNVALHTEKQELYNHEAWPCINEKARQSSSRLSYAVRQNEYSCLIISYVQYIFVEKKKNIDFRVVVYTTHYGRKTSKFVIILFARTVSHNDTCST